jgi:hypothetical protein
MKVSSARGEDYVNERIDWLFCDVSGPHTAPQPDNIGLLSTTAAVRKLTNPFLRLLGKRAFQPAPHLQRSGHRHVIAAALFFIGLAYFWKYCGYNADLFSKWAE